MINLDMEHDRVHWLDIDDYGVRARCTAPEGAPCRLECADECPAAQDGDGCDCPNRRDMGECGWCVWLSEYEGTAHPDHPPLPINVAWDPDCDAYRYYVVGAPAWTKKTGAA